MVVISAGIRPNVELAKECGIACDRAIVVDDQLRTNDPAVFGVGECVQHNGMVYGLVAPLWEQTKVLAKVLTGTDPAAAYTGSKIATKLKVMGVELASMGRIADLKPTDEVVQFSRAGPPRVLEGDRPRREGECRVPARRPRPRRRPHADVPRRRARSRAPARTVLHRELGEEGSVARGPARLAPDLRLQRRLQGHHRRRDQEREVYAPGGRQGDASRHRLRLVQETREGVDRGRRGWSEGRPERELVRPRRAAGQAEPRRDGEGTRDSRACPPCCANSAPAEDEKSKAGLASMLKGTLGHRVHRRARRPIRQRPRPREHPEGRHVLGRPAGLRRRHDGR